MASLKTKFAVGLFVLIGTGIIVAALIWLGMSRYLEQGKLFVCYFDESVQGLNRDSAVKYRGVSIGRVESIGVAPDEKLIKVVVKIETGMKLSEDMVAQLKSVGITGIVFIEIDRKNPGEQDLSPKIHFPTQYPTVATKPSGMNVFMSGLNDALKQFRQLNLSGLRDRLQGTMNKIDQSIDDAQIKNISAELRLSLQKIEKALDRQQLNRLLVSLEDAARSFKKFSTKADQAVADIDKVVVGVDRIMLDNRHIVKELIGNLKQAVQEADTFFAKGSSLFKNSDVRLANLEPLLVLTLTNLENASTSLNHLADILSDDPTQIVFGQSPPARAVEPENTNAP